ncbi:MAG: VWA domain-containing protein [Promethearchaeota archaeon]
MKKTAIFMLSFLLLITSYLIPQNHDYQKSLFFVIDVSGSMQENNLFSRLKDEIKNYIKNETKKGDWVSIITFGTDVKIITSEYIREEKALSDTNSLLRKIDNLDAKEKFTFITGAIDILASQMGIAQKANPDHIVKAFIFTDGKNDPPPNAEGAKWTFEEILSKHYDIFDNPSTYLYILTLGIKPDESLVSALKDKDRTFINEVPEIEDIEIPTEIPEPKKYIEPQIIIDISGPKKLFPGDNVKYTLNAKVTETNDEAIGKNFYIQAKLVPPVESSLEKTKLIVKKNLEEKIPLILHKLQEGKYTVKVAVNSDTINSITPESFELNFQVKKFNPIPLIILGIIIIVAVLVFLYFRNIPKFPDDYVVVNTRENIEYELRDNQKFYSSSVSSKDLEILDVDFKLSISKKTGDVIAKVLIEGKEEEKIIKSGDMIIDPYKFQIRMF